VTSRFDGLVLCYHAISESWEHQLAIPQHVVERQIAGLLARGHRPVSASEVLAGRVGLHVTFDDAFRSVAALLPSLERLGVRSTIFVSANYADHGDPLSVAELADAVAAQPGELETMDWNGLRAVAERSVEIGSHTCTHAHLRSLSDAELASELCDSRERIAAELGRPCRFFAYPYGEHDARIRAAVKAAGYEAAFALRSASRQFDRYAVPRVDLYRRDGRLRVRLKVSAFGRWVRAHRDAG
jgi:peptidoglycan/xylan/chitin deacetylase (PgdA/CDA1 family)